jgi:ribosomal-protein-alanine N-acetyltransferase
VATSFGFSHGDVLVRIVRVRDAKELEERVLGNREWLRPWEATNPFGPNSFEMRHQIKALRRQMSANQGLPFVIEIDGRIVGQLNVSNMVFGSLSSATLGYWVVPEVAGRGVTPTAVALVIDYLFSQLGLHRCEIDIRPENVASLRVVEKLGMRFEGLKERYIHINGAWRDHYSFAITHEEVVGGLLNRWINGRTPTVDYPWLRENDSGIKHTELNDGNLGS